MSIQASRNNAISLQVAIEEYFRDNNLDEEITDYSFGNGAFTEWNFYCDGDDFKYIDDDVLYDYIADLREFRDENFEVFSFRDEISVKILDDDYEESKNSTRKSMRESININSILSKVEAIVSKTKIKHPKAEIIELDGTKYIYYSYFDRGFDDDGLDRVWNKCSDLKGVVDVGFGYGYGLENTKYENSLLIELDDDVIVESKKSARKSIVEKFNAPKDWDFDEMLNEYGEEYLNDEESFYNWCVVHQGYFESNEE